VIPVELLRHDVEAKTPVEILPFPKSGRFVIKQYIKACQSLLPINQDKRVMVITSICPSQVGRVIGLPDKKMPSGMSMVQGCDKATDLPSVPDITALELG